MSSNKQKSGGGVGLCSLVFIVFLILKLAEIGVVSNWSWWWVTSPLWIPLAISLAILFIVFIIKSMIQ